MLYFTVGQLLSVKSATLFKKQGPRDAIYYHPLHFISKINQVYILDIKIYY